ncbi:MAG: SHOCT-like domain-containing protein [bacterium]
MNEKTKILEMLNEGKISVDEAERLLNAIDQVKPDHHKKISKAISLNTDGNRSESSSKTGKYPRAKIKIIVDSKEGDNVRISIPLKLAKSITKFIPHSAMEDIEDEGIDIKNIVEHLDELVDELDEDLVNVQSSDGDNVRIFIERNE